VAAARDRVEANPARLEEVEERLATLTRVLRRHGPTEEDALTALANAETALADHRGGEDGTGALEARLADAERDALAAGVALNDKRRKASKPFAAAVKKSLADLGMAGTQFVID